MRGSGNVRRTGGTGGTGEWFLDGDLERDLWPFVRCCRSHNEGRRRRWLAVGERPSFGMEAKEATTAVLAVRGAG